MTKRSVKRRARSVLFGIIAGVLLGASLTASCRGKSISGPRSEISQQANSEPRETPVPLQATAQNKGKRCEARYYARAGLEEDNNPICYELQILLIDAVREGKLEDIREALRDGANVDGSVYDHDLPLFIAADNGKAGAVRLLLDNGANVNKGTFIRGTALVAAAASGKIDVVRILLERGANVCFKADGGTAGDFAQARGHQDAATILKAAEAENCK